MWVCFYNSRLPPQIVKETQKEISGPFKLDPEFINELDKMKPVLTIPQLHKPNFGFLYDTIKIPSREEAKAR